MGCCYNALPIDFNDPMANTHTSSLCNASSHKATDDPILHTKAQLISEVWSSDQDCGYWRTSNYVQFNPGLVFQTLYNALTC